MELQTRFADIVPMYLTQVYGLHENTYSISQAQMHLYIKSYCTDKSKGIQIFWFEHESIYLNLSHF